MLFPLSHHHKHFYRRTEREIGNWSGLKTSQWGVLAGWFSLNQYWDLVHHTFRIIPCLLIFLCLNVCLRVFPWMGEGRFWFLATSYHSKHKTSVSDVAQPFSSWHSVLYQYNRNSEAWSCQLPKDSTLWEQVCYGNTHLWTVMRNSTVTGDLKSTVWPHPLYCVQWLFFKIFFYVSSGQGFLAEHLPYFSSHDTCKINTF